MTAAARQDRLNRTTVSTRGGYGTLVTFTRAGATTGVQVAAYIAMQQGPLWGGGEISVSEAHYTGRMLTASLATPPAIGDRLATTDGIRYEIDQTPISEAGLYTLVIRRLPDA